MNHAADGQLCAVRSSGSRLFRKEPGHFPRSICPKQGCGVWAAGLFAFPAKRTRKGPSCSLGFRSPKCESMEFVTCP